MKSYIITPQQQDEIKKRDFSVYTFKVGNKKYQCYSKLMFYLLSDNPEMVNRETQQVEIVDKRPILDVYANAFDEGVQTFNSDFRVDTSVLYSTNADVYIKTLIEKFNEPHTGWKWGSEEFNLIVTPTNIEKIGRLSGTRFAFEKLKKNNSSIFEKYEGKGITPPPPPPAKLIKSLTKTQQAYLYSKLTEKSLFLPVGTDFDNFCFVFGNSMKPENFKPLKWLKNRQFLRELITTLKHPDITIPTSKYKLPPYFLDEKEKPIAELPTNTPKGLKIEHYITDLAKM